MRLADKCHFAVASVCILLTGLPSWYGSTCDGRRRNAFGCVTSSCGVWSSGTKMLNGQNALGVGFGRSRANPSIKSGESHSDSISERNPPLGNAIALLLPTRQSKRNHTRAN